MTGKLDFEARVGPTWAHAFGFDAFGPRAEVRVHDATLVMRWIPSGSFVMGSPADEAGRYDHEVQHSVELTRGYWLADAPVTQALWTAVMGENPAKFKHPARPVETVSWTAAQLFIARLNKMLPGLAVRLPTEAEWEYACRAGTVTATYAGDLEILGIANAPVLDAIAWYGGNSGVDFDLPDGDPPLWGESQYAFDSAGTRVVRLKAPNGWGLYDMLGNVWEWCSDWRADYTGDAVDPKGPDTVDDDADRVVRGGCWLYGAEGVRAACRAGFAPNEGDRDLGFRLAHSVADR